MKYFIRTFGCQANEADSEKLAAVLEKQGYKAAKKIDEADVVVINTCSVRESAENRVFGLVNNLAKKAKYHKPSAKCHKLILTGCMVGSARGERQRYSMAELRRKLPQVDEFQTIEELVGPEKISPKRKDKLHAYVAIMEGCDHFCSYCVVPYARGKERSRPFEEIICEVKKLVKRGYKEITLLGQNVNSYGKDFSWAERKKIPNIYDISIYHIQTPFAALLYFLNKIKGLRKIKFLTSNPWDLTDDIIEAMKLPKIDHYLHLPVQSGDDQILRKMNRHYTAKDYLSLVKKLRRQVPDVKIGTDIIVGFPGETKEQFQKTVGLCKKVGFVKAYIAKYSPRPGTAAFKLKDDISPEEKKRRWRVLEELINKRSIYE